MDPFIHSYGLTHSLIWAHSFTHMGSLIHSHGLTHSLIWAHSFTHLGALIHSYLLQSSKQHSRVRFFTTLLIAVLNNTLEWALIFTTLLNVFLFLQHSRVRCLLNITLECLLFFTALFVFFFNNTLECVAFFYNTLDWVLFTSSQYESCHKHGRVM